MSEISRQLAVLDGPSLQTYVETRLNLITEAMKENHLQHDLDMNEMLQTTRLADSALRAFIEAQQAAADIRYQQRFEAQSDALAAAFLSQQTAMQTALAAAKEAVAAALAAQDRAGTKAEIAADKRFEALNELRQMLNSMLATLMTRSESDAKFAGQDDKIEAGAKRQDALETRFNIWQGESVGGRRTKDDNANAIRNTVAIVGGIVGVISLLFLFYRFSVGR